MSDPYNALVHDGVQPGSGGGPLAGMRVTVKDNVDVAGMPTRAASPVFAGEPAQADAPVVAALRAAGATIAGKANMHELAFGVTSENPFSGWVGNPVAPGRIAGGSSGGTAAAIAAGLVVAGIASDTGGSARIPAAFCRIAGFRPSSGRYPSSGIVLASRTFDTAGLMAPSADTVRQLDAAIAGTSVAPAPPLDGVRLAVPRGDFWREVDETVARAVEDAFARLHDAGCELVERDLDGYSPLEARSFHSTIVSHEAERIWRALAESRGESLPELARRIATPQVRTIFEALAAGEGPSEEEYRRALEHELPRGRDAIVGHLRETDAAAIAVPAVPLVPPPAGPRSPEADAVLFDVLTRNMLAATLAAQPSISLPIAAELPVGLLLDGRPGEDEALLALAVAVEQALA